MARFEVWGTAATLLVQPPSALSAARAILRDEIEAVDRTCSRFRPDSELSSLNRTAAPRGDGARGRTLAAPGEGARAFHCSAFHCSELLFEALQVAVGAAARTQGAVDPTVGRALEALGYDADYDSIGGADPDAPMAATPLPAPGWRAVHLDASDRTATLAEGVSLDLGATAKAWCADRVAARVSRETGAGVLVDLGGDLAIAGPAPANGWHVAVTDDAKDPASLDHAVEGWTSARLPPAAGGAGEVASRGAPTVVTVHGGGLASSGTTVRSWRRAGRQLHHIIDPSTGWPAEPVWRMVTVAAGSSVDANTAATAAVVWGHDAPFRIAQLGLPARFVGADGAVIVVGGWPSPAAPQAGTGASRQAGPPASD